MESVEKGDDDTALKSLIDLAETCPKFLRPQLNQLFVACTKIFADKEQLDTWRHLALEIVVTLAETAPAMVRKVAGEIFYGFLFKMNHCIYFTCSFQEMC